MPIAELLGVQFDMQVLLKLSVSMAAVLLVSWAYRFYSSRDATKNHVCSKDNKEPENITCRNCKMTLRYQNSPKPDTNDGNSATDDETSESTKETATEAQSHKAAKSEDAYCDHDVSLKREKLIHQEQAKVANSNISFGSTLNPPYPTESGMAGTTGRRSPCFLQKLEGNVGVERELRQDLERQGAYSSFLSKAEIKVEDANLVMEGTGDQIVRRKIYDYYVQSSSHCITESNTKLGQLDKSSESQPVGFRSRGSSLTESPSSLSPIIMGDLVLPKSTVEEPTLLESLKLRQPTRPVLLRKESYLSATEHSELCSPVLTSSASATKPPSLGPTSSESITCHAAIFSSQDKKDPNAGEAENLETVAEAPFLHLPAYNLDYTTLERLKSKLDLGNCLETLFLAKKQGQTTVQWAALGVMSDSYLQVLRDPNIYGRLMADEREQIQKQRMRGRRFVAVADMDPQDWSRNIRRLAPEREQRTSSAVYYYDDYKDTWHTLCIIPEEVISKACAMCTMDNYLFVAVGCQGTDREMIPSKRVFCYNPLTSIWTEISPMNEARPCCKLAALDGFIYAIGGECLSSVERYDPQVDRWTFVAPLPNDTFAVAHHVTVSNGELYVSGGTLRYMLLRYSPKTNTWRSSPLVGSEDRTADMVAVRRCLYRFDINPVLGVSVYRYHTAARLWYECSSKRLLHCPAFQCVTMYDHIYCINREFTMRFQADEISPSFMDENLSVLSAAKGILFPFVLSLPDKKPQQTSV